MNTHKMTKNEADRITEEVRVNHMELNNGQNLKSDPSVPEIPVSKANFTETLPTQPSTAPNLSTPHLSTYLSYPVDTLQ